MLMCTNPNLNPSVCHLLLYCVHLLCTVNLQKQYWFVLICYASYSVSQSALSYPCLYLDTSRTSRTPAMTSLSKVQNDWPHARKAHQVTLDSMYADLQTYLIIVCLINYIYGHLLAISYLNLHVKEMYIDKMDFAISNYDQRKYRRHDERGSVVVTHAVDNFTILASSPVSQQLTIEEIREVYPDITTHDPLDTFLGLEVTRDRLKSSITLKQQVSIHDCLSAHYPEWRGLLIDDSPWNFLTPMAQMLFHEIKYYPMKIKNCTSKKVRELVWITHTVPEVLFTAKLKAKKNTNPNVRDEAFWQYYQISRILTTF